MWTHPPLRGGGIGETHHRREEGELDICRQTQLGKATRQQQQYDRKGAQHLV